MSNGKGSAIGIIAIIVGASGLGMGVFSTIRLQVVEGPPGLDGTDGINGINGTLDNLVAIWENLTGIGTPALDFPIGLYDIQVNNSEYFSLESNNINVQLTKSGWYRFTIRVLWTGTVAGNDYRLYIVKNGFLTECIKYVESSVSFYTTADTFGYVLSDGDDIFSLKCYTGDATPFYLHSGQGYNQLVLEYVGDLP